MQFKMSESPCNKFSTIQRGTVRPPPCIGALHELPWDDPLFSRWGTMSQGKNRSDVVPGEIQHHSHQVKWFFKVLDCVHFLHSLGTMVGFMRRRVYVWSVVGKGNTEKEVSVYSNFWKPTQVVKTSRKIPTLWIWRLCALACAHGALHILRYICTVIGCGDVWDLWLATKFGGWL